MTGEMTGEMQNACEICSRRSGASFVTISKRYQKYTHVVKSHVCSVCHDILIEQQHLDGTTVEVIGQQEYNELPEVEDKPNE